MVKAHKDEQFYTIFCKAYLYDFKNIFPKRLKKVRMLKVMEVMGTTIQGEPELLLQKNMVDIEC